MNFNKSAIASVVTASLAVVTSANAQQHSQQDYFVAQNSSVINKSFYAKAQQAQHTVTKSGMKNHFDRQLGQMTFQWANKNITTPDLGAIANEQKVAYVSEHYLHQLTGLSTEKLAPNKAVLANIHDLGRGARVAKYKQEVNGIEVFNREFNIMIDPEMNLVASTGYFADNKATQSVLGGLSATDMDVLFGDAGDAVARVFAEMGGDASTLTLAAKDEHAQYVKFAVKQKASDYQIHGEPRAKKVYFDYKNKLVPAYYVEVEAANKNSVESDYYAYVISSIDHRVLVKNNLTAYENTFNYRVYADTDGIHKPWQGPHGKVVPAESADQVDTKVYLDAPMVSLASGPISTNDPWLADDATTTSGNNVHAYVDAIAPDGFTNGDFDSSVTSDHTFDYKYDTTQPESSMHNRKAAIVNLFYMNNFLHDWFYDHGFDEASGNAQMDNYGRGGVEGDPLRAEVQDNSGFNNANMSTPADGGRPRMQMYLWDSKDAVNGEDYGITVTSHEDLGLLDSTKRSAFGPGQFMLKGDIVRIDDGTDEVTDGCEEAVNADALAGNIAIIDRGACAFTQKVLNAQAAGAVGVIIANNRDGDVPAPMGGSNDAVTIPNMGISQNEGAAIYAKLDAKETVSVSMFNDKPFKGSSWDNAIVAHEWGHYISNRLIGNGNGLINNQGRSMGEGWGDFHALLMLANAKDAEIPSNEEFQKAYAAISYVDSFYYGIRRYPYSTNMEVNPLTFKNISLENGAVEYPAGTSEVHDAGTIWATMLWDVYVSLINDPRHSFSEAESLMMDYLVAGYKLTPIAPTFTEARDAILAAAYANDPEDYKVMLAAFARRGLGLGAESPSRFSASHDGVVESYETEMSSFGVNSVDLNTNYEGLTTGYCSNDNILDKGETGTVAVTLQNQGSEALSGLTGQIEVTSGQDVTFANDGKVTFGDLALFGKTTSAPIEFTLNDAATADNLAFKVSFPELAEGIKAQDFEFSTTVNMDFKVRELTSNADTDNMESVSTLHDLTENVMIGGDMAKGTAVLDQTYNYLFPVDQQYLLLWNNEFTSDVAYETRTFTVGYGGNFTIEWWQYFQIEESWDGGVVEVSVNGGEWADVTTMGGQFEGLGYTGAIDDRSEAAIAGRNAFTGAAPWPGYTERLNFGTALNGNEVKFRFRIASDSNTTDFGWFIDNLTFSNINTPIFSDVVAGDTFACDNRLPYVTVSDDVTVDEGGSATLSVSATDPNGDALTYSWKQVAGTPATLSGTDTETLSIIAPQIAVKETMKFEVTVSDGQGSTTATGNVVVNVVPPKATVKPTSSSGGSTGLIGLLLLPWVWLRRKTR